MAQSKLYPVVMAGGSGSRLWPLSRVLYPKQFFMPERRSRPAANHHLPPERGVECESPVVICNEQHRFIVAEQLRQLKQTYREHYSRTGRAKHGTCHCAGGAGGKTS